MTDLIYDYITMGVDMIICAAVLAAVVVLLRGSVTLSQFSAMQQANADRVNYYKEYSIYDNTTGLSSADAISALQYYKNDLQVYVYFTTNSRSGNVIRCDNKTGKFYRSTNGGGSWTEVSSENLSTYIKSNYVFKCHIGEDGAPLSGLSDSYSGGVITSIVFERTK